MINQVNKKIKEIISSDEKAITGYLNNCAQYNGKRLRAKLLLSSCGAFSRITDKAIELAAIIEIIHLASLLHDDVVDNVGVRRGKKALNVLFGNRTSILLADYLLAKAMNILCNEKDAAILNIIMETVKIMSKGQLNEIANKGNLRISKDDYFKAINQKTASLFSASCKIGAMSGKSGPKDILAMEKFGASFGMLFQVTDDMLDFWGDEKKLGKPVFSDLMDKNFTIPVIILLKEADIIDRKKISLVLKSENINKIDAKKIFAYFNKYSINEKSLKIVLKYYNEAQSSLSSLKDSSAKENLKLILTSALKREK